MNYIVLLFCSFLLPIISFKQVKPKLCINCKYFIPYNDDNDNAIDGKCSFFPKKEGKINYLISGINENEYYYCSTVRGESSMCGEDGVKYKKKIVKNDKKDKNLNKNNKTIKIML